MVPVAPPPAVSGVRMMLVPYTVAVTLLPKRRFSSAATDVTETAPKNMKATSFTWMVSVKPTDVDTKNLSPEAIEPISVSSRTTNAEVFEVPCAALTPDMLVSLNVLVVSSVVPFWMRTKSLAVGPVAVDSAVTVPASSVAVTPVTAVIRVATLAAVTGSDNPVTVV